MRCSRRTSRHHISFWKLILAEDTWATRREDGFRELALPVEPDGPMDRLRTAFRVAAAQFAEGLSENPFATVEEGKVHLKKKDTLRVPKSVKTLRRLIETRLPRRRRPVENVLRGRLDFVLGSLVQILDILGVKPRSSGR